MGKPMKTGWFGQTPYIPEKELDIYDVGTLPELVVTSAPNPTFTTKKIYNPNYSFNSENADISIIPATYINPRYDSTKRQNLPSFSKVKWMRDYDQLTTWIANKLADDPKLESEFKEKFGSEIMSGALQKLAERLAIEESLKENQIYDFGTLPEPEVIKETPIVATQNSPKSVITTNSSEAPKTNKVTKKENTTNPNINDLVKQTILGKFGNGTARKAALGDNYAAVLALINKQLAGKRKTPKVNIPKIEQKYVTIEPGHEPPTEPIDIPQYFIDKHFELTNTPLTGAEIAAIRMDPFNLQTMPEEEIDMIIEESPEEKELARAERKELRKENRAQRKEARKQRRLSRRSKNNKTE